MELLYVWIEKYKNIEKQGFNFSPKYRFSFDENTKKLRPDEGRRNKVIDNFFGEKISNITAIVGENGSGKTSIIQFLISENILHDYGVSLMVFKLGKDILKKNDIFGYMATGLEYDIEAPHNFIDMQNKDKYNWKIPMHIIYFSNVFEIYQNIVDVYNNRFYFSNLSLSYQLFEYTENIEKNKVEIDRGEEGNFRAFNNLTLFKYKQYRVFNDFLAYIEAFDIGELGEMLDFKGVQNSIIIFKYNYSSFVHKFRKISIISRSIYQTFDIELKKTLFSIFILFNIQKQFKKDDENSIKLSTFIDKCLKEELIFKDFLFILKNENKPIYDFISSFYERGFYENVTWNEEDYRNLSFRIDMEMFGIFTVIQEKLLKELKIDDFIAEVDWGLSSGEYALLNLFSRFLPAKAEYDEESSSDEIESYLLLLDEADLYLHPNWAKKFIYYLVNVLPKIFEEKSIQIILTTHSPFVLSDLPKENVIFLKNKDGKCEVQNGSVDIKQTFGANIHTLLKDDFFLKSTIGEFATKKIDEILIFYHDLKSYDLKKNKSKIKKMKANFKTKSKEFEYVVECIGEPYIKVVLENNLKEINKILEKYNDES